MNPPLEHPASANEERSVRRPYEKPEIQRVELSDVALQLAAQGVSDLEGFDFLDRPDPGRITLRLSCCGRSAH
mgnify:CR=1 FL=1